MAISHPGSSDLAVVTALAADQRSSPRAALLDALVALGHAPRAERALAADVHEVELDLPGDEPPRARARDLRAALLARLHGPALDLAVAVDRPPPRAPRLFVFDMDSTLITIEVIDELARRHGVGAEVAAVTARAMAGELDFEASLRARVARLAGLPADVLADVAATLPITAGAARLVDVVHRLGGRAAVVSGGFTFAATALAARLGLDHAHANTLALADGHLTGAVVGAVVTPARKAALVGELAAVHGLDLACTVAVGDGANDLLMLERAGLGVAFHAKPKLAAAADTALSVGGLDRALYLLGLSADEQAALAS